MVAAPELAARASNFLDTVVDVTYPVANSSPDVAVQILGSFIGESAVQYG